MIKLNSLPKIQSVLKTNGRPEFVILRCDEYKKLLRNIKVEGSIDETEYKAKYDDVKKAVESGKLSSATHHYIASGYAEGRQAKILKDTPPAIPGFGPLSR